MKRFPARIVLLPALICAIVQPAGAATKDGHLDITVAPGYDTNPKELHDAVDSREGGVYTELGLDAGLSVQWTPVLGTFADLDGAIRSYESDLSEADRDWVDMRAGATLTPWRRGARGFAVAFGGTLGAYRTTYVDPATGETYESFDGSEYVPAPDRFDFDAAGAFADFRWRSHERVLLYLDSEMRRRRYVEDYSPVLSPLDDRTLTMEPGVLFDLSARVRVDVSWRWSDRRYDDLPALDAGAVEVPGEDREYRGNRYNVTFGFEPFSTLRFAIGFNAQSRDDRYAGYYDNSGTTAYASVDYEIGDRTRVHGWVARRELEYDNATIDNTVNGEGLDNERLLIVGRAERDLTRHVSLFGEAGMDHTDSRDPLFTYDREWARVGCRFRL